MLQTLLANYKYYDQPDGNDPFTKLISSLKISLPASAFAAITHRCLLSDPQNFRDVLNLSAFYTVPIVGMGFAFVTATYISTNMRGKDDPLNYAIGGMAAGAVFHKWRKNGIATFYATLAFMLAGAVKKDVHMKNWVFWKDYRYVYGNYRTDYSLVKEYPRGWGIE